ncbi:MAG: TetR/AcrR family transcriptional regulator [Deltaproteobacteria bacterium]|nr:TetR/AcrR family transcriptional regulator [Deltaproteobacteria bacterium]
MAGRSRSEAPTKDTSSRIYEAADELFCLRGYDGVSVGDIAALAGVQKPLVFYHHGTKEALFEKILVRYYEAHRAALEAAYREEGEPRARLHGLMDAYFDFISKNRRYAALVQQQVSNPETHPLIQKHLEPLFGWIEEVLLRVTPNEGPLAARQFFVTFSGMVINYFTYAPFFARAWGDDPLSARALEERREHLHWLIDRLLDGLERGAREAKRPTRRMA